MKLKENDKIVFLDIDGVLTAYDDNTSYETCGKAENYGLSRKCLKNLLSLLKDTDAKVVISSNWARLEDYGVTTYKFHNDAIHSKLPELRETLGERCIGNIPSERYLRKSERVILWFEDNDFNGNYVIFDDDLNEGYQCTTDHGINRHFVKTDPKCGLSEEDVENAKKILNS